jgi:hypothetical protein
MPPARAFVALCLAAVVAAPGFAQYGRSRSGRISGRGPSASASPYDMPLVTFRGTLRSISAKKLALDSEESNEVEFNLTRKTSVLDGEKKIKLADLKEGARLEIEARRAGDGTLDATIVHVAHGEKKAE